MIETVLRLYLQEALGVPVYMEFPSNAPAEFLLLEKTGSSNRNCLIASTFAVKSYAASLYEAAELNSRVKDAMNNAVRLPEVSHSELNSDYPFPDLSNMRYRYQAVYDIYYYE